MSLSGKVAIVTGAGSGIGAATALILAREGALVALVDLNETRLTTVAEQCVTHNKPLIISADVSKESDAKAIITKTITTFGKLNVLVNNAGVYKKLLITDPDYMRNFDLLMNINMRSVVLMTSLAAPHLKATKGNIVNLCSVASTLVNVGNSSYCVSKAAVEHFTRSTALEFAAFGVRVNCVNPGLVRTNILDVAVEIVNDPGNKFWQEFSKLSALNRVSEPEEIADVILFLVGEKSKGITGSAFVCDNGYIILKGCKP